jgi:hypothetical protein
MPRNSTTALLTCFLFLGLAVRAEASPADSDSAPIVVLRGDLESKKALGPAGWVLKRPMPLPAKGLALRDDSGDPPKGFRELQLVCDYAGYPECEAVLKRSVGHAARIVGQTARSAEGAGQLPVIMHVRVITVLQ